MFDRVLVANRGEIAIRVMRALRDLEIETVAVYSEADRHALHVRMADHAVCVGPEASSESYLVVEAIIDAARRSGAQAIHPGYGFLSENAAFARRVVEAGFVWIGPPPSAIEQMGDKLTARRLMEAAGVPTVPGNSEAISSPEEALQIARQVGFPVMVKASAGGGGKGMRLVETEADLLASVEAASREALKAFGNPEVFIEKFVIEPHHVEIQVLCDAHGNALWVGERECSVQRRHQKVIEECPSPFITAETRAQMGAVAVKAAEACHYVGAGTVEFLVGHDQRFYFLEMNTRLQVEHPVTELVYAVDLVEAQLRIAAGEPLDYGQADLQARGHALQCRIYAEDPQTFMPSPGKITALKWPEGPGVRVDAGVDRHSTVPMAYDPMIAKICTFGRTRDQAIRRMLRALDETTILGITTNIELHRRVLRHAAFCAGRYDTGILGTTLPDAPSEPPAWHEAVLIAAAIERLDDDLNRGPVATGDTGPSAWLQLGRARRLGGG